jgi:Protein of unknown function (DUF2987)
MKTQHITSYSLIALLAIGVLGASTPSFAQASITAAAADTALPERVEPVIVNSPKNAAVMPYDAVYDRLKRLQDSKLDRITLQIKVAPKQDGLKLSDVRVAIVNDKASVNLPIAADGSINVPLRADLYQTDAEIRSNQVKGALGGSVEFAVSWPGGNEIAYAEVEETVRQAQMAGKDLIGWFGYMLFFPSLANFEVPVQFPAPRGQTMRVMKDGRVVETYSADDKGLLKFKLKRDWEKLQPVLVFSEALPKR